ncbi:MAG: hypothetical protein JOZ69_14590 [Myxococcales bacterium]|nr:hypothetical protein [Myxococcales bacterium]
MRRAQVHAGGLGTALAIALVGTPPAARADTPATVTWPAPAPAVAPGPPLGSIGSVTAAPLGVAVAAPSAAADAAWPLAQAVYATPSLRPPGMDEARARVLCGEPPPADAAPELKDLADRVGLLRGDDAPTRAVLLELARRLGVRAILVVTGTDGRATARAFAADVGAFDAAVYAPDAGSSSGWSGTVGSLVRTFGSSAPAALQELPAPTHAPPLASREAPGVRSAPGPDATALARAPAPVPGGRPEGRAFYQSGWFWAALGAAAFGAGAVFLATRDSTPKAIHLELQVPR